MAGSPLFNQPQNLFHKKATSTSPEEIELLISKATAALAKMNKNKKPPGQPPFLRRSI
jgi:hypothetical protein